MRRLLGTKKVDPSEQAKVWNRSIAKEIRDLERQIKSIEAEEAKHVREIKKLAQARPRNDTAIKVMAKHLVQSRKAKMRMIEGKSQMNSVKNQLQIHMSVIKLAGVMSKSTDIMKSMSAAINIPELQETMTDLAREMERAGLVEEIISDGMSTMDTEGTDELADEEVERIVRELVEGKMEGVSAVPTTIPSMGTGISTVQGEEEKGQGEYEGGHGGMVGVDDAAELQSMRARLEEL